MLALRATQPSLLARMVYHVGSPAIFDGKRFLPETGTPMRKMLRNRTLFADCEPEPFTVAIWREKSLTISCSLLTTLEDWACTTRSLVAMERTLPLSIQS